jgi:hypothetical protein
MSPPRPDRPTPPSPRAIRLYRHLSKRYGEEPKDLWVFDPAEYDDPPPHLTLKQVMVWPVDAGCDVTGFHTLGMSDRLMPGADYAAELHLGVRAWLRKAERERLSRWLVNVAEYPFHYGRTLDWWHVLSNPGPIPHFPNCPHLILHPRLTAEGFDTIEDRDGLIKVFYVVPITPLERHLAVDLGGTTLPDYWAENGIDVLSDRTDPKPKTRRGKR